MLQNNKSLIQLQDAYSSSGVRWEPEDSPFSTLFADITHRCNMTCRNCYIPNRDLPDLPVDWLYGILERLPRRTRIRLVGAEPTMREDLPQIIQRVREMGHLPVILSNGLKLGRISYVKKLKSAGLRTVYLSMNGGLEDDLYEQIDELRCAKRKLKALDNLLTEKINVTVGMIIIRGINDSHVGDFLQFLSDQNVRDIHLRSVGPIGRYMPDNTMTLDQLDECFSSALSIDHIDHTIDHSASHRDVKIGRTIYQLTAWPDLGSEARGRITPDGRVEQFFESIIANGEEY